MTDRQPEIWQRRSLKLTFEKILLKTLPTSPFLGFQGHSPVLRLETGRRDAHRAIGELLCRKIAVVRPDRVDHGIVVNHSAL